MSFGSVMLGLGLDVQSHCKDIAGDISPRFTKESRERHIYIYITLLYMHMYIYMLISINSLYDIIWNRIHLCNQSAPSNLYTRTGVAPG